MNSKVLETEDEDEDGFLDAELISLMESDDEDEEVQLGSERIQYSVLNEGAVGDGTANDTEVSENFQCPNSKYKEPKNY